MTSEYLSQREHIKISYCDPYNYLLILIFSIIEDFRIFITDRTLKNILVWFLILFLGSLVVASTGILCYIYCGYRHRIYIYIEKNYLSHEQRMFSAPNVNLCRQNIRLYEI